jgi:hypothetical protein
MPVGTAAQDLALKSASTLLRVYGAPTSRVGR